MTLATRIHVTPVKGRRVRDVFGRPVPPEGKTVPDAQYWHRRERAGDVAIKAAPRASRAKPSKSTSRSKPKGSDA